MYLSIASLILSNAFMYYYALTEHWSFTTIIMAYWFQSIIIGFFQVLRMLRLKDFSVKDLKINGDPVPDNPKSKFVLKYFLSTFFVIHFGLFHVVYLMFIGFGLFGPIKDLSGILLTSAIFFVNHLISFLINTEETDAKARIDHMMFAPYARIIPMHLTIIFGTIIKLPLEIFMILKTIADVIPHFKQHTPS